MSISREIASFAPRQGKCYYTSYSDVGFELGFGRAGLYSGHSHLRFVDLLFAPDGIRYVGLEIACTLLIVPPRTYLPDVESGGFMFLKFCPAPGEVVLPEKIDAPMHEARILVFGECASATFPWYPDARARPQAVTIDLRDGELTILLGGEKRIVIVD